jgi:hypothetical protein
VPFRLTQGLTWCTILVLAAIACDGRRPPGPDPFPLRETAVILNSTDLSITVFPSASASDIRTIGLAPAGSPVTVAARNQIVVVPMGFLATAAIVELHESTVSTIPLPDNSGATGVEFFNDSIIYVANPNLNTVSRINVFSGVHENEIDVGVFPQAVATDDSLVFVLNGELENFVPARPGSISVIDPGSDSVVATISLTGTNPSAAVFWFGRLYVVNSGSFGQGDGSLSVVNPNTLQEVAHYPGFGEFPGDIAISVGAIAYVSSFGYGVAVWDIVGDSFISPPSDPLVVEGETISSGVGIDAAGFLYTLIPGDCIAPSILYRVGADTTSIGTGACPIDITFTRFDEE